MMACNKHKSNLIPLFGESISAGFPSPAQDYVEAAIDLNKELIKHPSATFIARVTGDSLIDAGLDIGDLVIDPCAGSGTTLIPAMQCSRKVYGFEIKKRLS